VFDDMVCNSKNVHLAKILREIVDVYDEGKVRKWYRLFKEGRTNLHDEE
jgi:hypothetical protein